MTAEVIDYATGEVITTPPTDLVPFQASVVDRTAEGVVAVLTNARQWLASAVEMTGPAEVAFNKAIIVTAETYAKELGLSKEIQMDATEMVRRAEYALGKAIRKGQAEGTVATEREMKAHAGHVRQQVANSELLKPRPSDFLSDPRELSANKAGIYQMTDVSPEGFEEAITEAKSEGNLSRANVVRKIKGQQSFETRDDRAREVARLAALGYSSRQIAPQIGVGQEALAAIVRDYGITVKADRHIAGTHAADTNRIIEKAVSALEGIALGLDLIDPSAIDPERAQNWANSLTQSIAALSKARRQIKESVHVQS